MPAEWDEDAHPRDAQGRFASALASWAERRAGIAARVNTARTERDAAVRDARSYRDAARRSGEIAAGKEQAVGALREGLGTKGPIAVQLAGQARSQREMERIARERSAEATARYVDKDNVLARLNDEKEAVLGDKPRRENFPEPRTAPPVGAAIDAVGRPPAAPQAAPGTPSPPPTGLGRVPRDPAVYGRYAGMRAGEIPEALNHAHIANATRAEQRRMREAGQTPFESGSREHRAFVDRFREQHRAARDAVRGGATPAAAAPRQEPRQEQPRAAAAPETRVSASTSAHPNQVQITPRSPAERETIKAENTRASNERTAIGLDRLFGDRVPRVDDFARGFGLNDGTKAKIELHADGYSASLNAQHYDRATGQPMLSNCSREYSRGTHGAPADALVVYHAHFNVKPEFRSTGVGAQILSNSVRLAHQMGVQEIRTSPAGSRSGLSYSEWVQREKDIKENHRAYKAGEKTFDQMKQKARQLDLGYIGPAAWASFGFKHGGSYEERFRSYLHDHHFESLTKAALGTARHAELMQRVSVGKAPPGGNTPLHPRVGEHVRSAHDHVTNGPSNNDRVTAAREVMRGVQKHLAAGTLTREHLTQAQQTIASHYNTEQQFTAYGSPARVALNQAQQALTTAASYHGRSLDRDRGYGDYGPPRPAIYEHMTAAERTAVKDKARQLAEKVGGQARDIHGYVLDGKEVGRHFMTCHAGEMGSDWVVKINARDKGWQMMKERLRLHDLNP